MQTLEYYLAPVFESIPGKNILLQPNPPFFTIASVSDAYLKHSGVKRKNFVGHPFSKLLNFDTSVDDEARQKIIDSLELTCDSKQPQIINIKTRDGKLLKVEHKPVLSPTGEIIYIVQHRRVHRSVKDREHSEFFLGDILMKAPVGIAVVSGRNFVVKSANLHMLDLWGRSNEIIGKPIIEGLPELHNQPFPQLLENVFNTGVEYHGFETMALLQKGGELNEGYFNFLYSPIKNQGGEVEGVLMVATDVTSLVKAKRELEESEKRYRDLIDTATVATAVYIGEKMEIHLANDAMLKLWGKDASAIGKPLLEALPELEGQPFMQLLQMVYKTGVTYRSTEDVAELVVDGKKQSFYFNFTYKALRNANGCIYGILNMAVDVTEIVTAKNRVAEAEERWRVALDSAELGTWDFYPATGEIVCSQQTRQLFGLAVSDENLTVKQLIAAVAKSDQERIRDVIGKALNNPAGDNFRIEYELTGIDDSKRRWHRITGHVFFDQDSKPYRLTGTLLDITERKRVEEALEERVLMRTVELLEANEKLERSNRELEQYAYVASHDLQEPLRKILVYADMLKRSSGFSQGTDAIRVEKISSAAQRMSHLIQDLLNFSRLLKSENIFALVNLEEVVRDVVDDFDLKILETKAKIDIEELPEVEGSRQQLTQLFQNLISNALKFRKENEPPVIKITSRQFDKRLVRRIKALNPDLKYHCITVEDNGIGFSERYHEQIFEIFKRLHNKSAYEGTGIGLALCRKIARNHNGDITAESVEGQGAKFSVILPAKQPGEKSADGHS